MAEEHGQTPLPQAQFGDAAGVAVATDGVLERQADSAAALLQGKVYPVAVRDGIAKGSETNKG